MSKIKALILSLALLTTTSAYAYYNFICEIPLPGSSMASTQLQENTVFSVYAFGLRIATKDCFTVAITNTEVSKPLEGNKWEEIWSLKACERVGRLPIEFTKNADGTESFAVDYMNIKWKTIGQ